MEKWICNRCDEDVREEDGDFRQHPTCQLFYCKECMKDLDSELEMLAVERIIEPITDIDWTV